MNFDQLKYFTTIAETLNYSRSSQILNVTQPALSLSIARLEDEIGYPLFIKKGRNIELSPYGERFYEHANNMLNNLKIAMTDIASLDEDGPQSIAIALNICFNYEYINKIITEFQKKYPRCNMDIMQMDYSDIMPALKHGHLPFAITHMNEKEAAAENLCAVSVAEYPLFVFVSEKNPLAKEDLVTIPMLNESNLLAKTFKFKEAVLKSESKRYAPKTITVVADTATMERMTANNEGVMTGNYAYTPQMRERGIKRIPYANIITPYTLIWNSNRLLTKTECIFRDFVQEYVKKHPLDPNTI